MRQRIKTLFCLLLTICLATGCVTAFAAGGHAYETEIPPNMGMTAPPGTLKAPVPTEAPADGEEAPSITDAVNLQTERTATDESTTDPEPEPQNAAEQQKETPSSAGQSGTLMTPHYESEPETVPAANGQEKAEEQAEQPAEPEQPAETANDAPGQQVSNQDDAYELNLPTGEELSESGEYVYALHTRTDAYNPASVLISGVLFASPETEIMDATVTPDGGKPHMIPGSEILRTRIGSEPASVATLTFEPDRERAGFAFLVDLSEDELPDGPVPVTVTLTINRVLPLKTTVILNKGLGQYYHVTRAIREQCLSLADQGDHVQRFQERLNDLGYLKEEELSGTFDEKTLAAARELLNQYQRNAGNEYLNPEEVGFILSEQPGAKPEGEKGFFEKIADFFQNNVPLFGQAVPVWMLTAAGAALLLIILIVILLITGRKKKARRREMEASSMNELSRRSAFITGQKEAEQGQQILTVVGDEPTMDLAEAETGSGLVYSGDEPTTDLNTPLYAVKVRLIYSGQYMDTAVRLQEGEEAVIGRGDGVQIQTNPADTSVSHQHGKFGISHGMVTYTDNSRNGTRFNSQRTLHRGDTVSIPLNTKAQMEIGNHKVLVIANNVNG